MRTHRSTLPGLSIDESIVQVYNNLIGFGPLTEFIEKSLERRITEIKVKGVDEIYTKECGVWKNHPEMRFRSREQLDNIVNRILAGSDKPLTESQAFVDNAELPDGSRVTMVRDPLTKSNLLMFIRIFTAGLYSTEALLNMGALTPQQLDVLSFLVRARMNLLYVGGTDTGKTTAMGACLGHHHQDTHIVTIEDANELQLSVRHPDLKNVSDLFTKKDEYTNITHVVLFTLGLRMSPDLFVFNEIRKAPETLVLLDAMISGHPGSTSTLHAEDAHRAVTRLVTNLREGDNTLTVELAREKVCEAIDAFVVVRRAKDGVRFVGEIVEPLWDEEHQQIRFHSIFVRPDYKHLGSFKSFSKDIMAMAEQRNAVEREEIEQWRTTPTS